MDAVVIGDDDVGEDEDEYGVIEWIAIMIILKSETEILAWGLCYGLLKPER